MLTQSHQGSEVEAFRNAALDVTVADSLPLCRGSDDSVHSVDRKRGPIPALCQPSAAFCHGWQKSRRGISVGEHGNGRVLVRLRHLKTRFEIFRALEMQMADWSRMGGDARRRAAGQHLGRCAEPVSDHQPKASIALSQSALSASPDSHPGFRGLTQAAPGTWNIEGPATVLESSIMKGHRVKGLTGA